MTEFKRIGLVGRPGHQGVADSLARLFSLLRKRNLQIVIDTVTRELLHESDVQVCPSSELSGHCDLVIVVGGDGTMLNAARYVAPDQVPIIGINRGKLGFLTDVLPGDIETSIEAVLNGHYSVEDHFLVEVEVRRGDARQPLGFALNDVVLHPGKAAQMIEFELFIDDSFVYSQESDGLIVATPTGSTAWALSAGGPVMHPQLDALVLVPMYPHSLTSRPIVIAGDSRVRLVVAAKEALEPQLSCDGEVRYTAAAGDEILVWKKAAPLRLIHPPGHSFYEACRSKLGWGRRLLRPDD